MRWDPDQDSPAVTGASQRCVKPSGSLGAPRTTCRATSDHGVPPGSLTEPRGAEFGRALLRLEVHVDQAEPVAIAVHPLELSWALQRKYPWTGTPSDVARWIHPARPLGQHHRRKPGDPDLRLDDRLTRRVACRPLDGVAAGRASTHDNDSSTRDVPFGSRRAVEVARHLHWYLLGVGLFLLAIPTVPVVAGVFEADGPVGRRLARARPARRQPGTPPTPPGPSDRGPPPARSRSIPHDTVDGTAQDGPQDRPQDEPQDRWP
jgi:hypothetical protein